MTDLPGMTSTTRTATMAIERARSFARFDILLAFTPGAGWISKRVITGPGATAVTSIFTPKSASFCTSSSDKSCRRSSEKPALPSLLGGSSKAIEGNGSLPLNNLPCRSRLARSLGRDSRFSSGSIFKDLTSATAFSMMSVLGAVLGTSRAATACTGMASSFLASSFLASSFLASSFLAWAAGAGLGSASGPGSDLETSQGRSLTSESSPWSSNALKPAKLSSGSLSASDAAPTDGGSNRLFLGEPEFEAVISGLLAESGSWVPVARFLAIKANAL